MLHRLLRDGAVPDFMSQIEDIVPLIPHLPAQLQSPSVKVFVITA